MLATPTCLYHTAYMCTGLPGSCPDQSQKRPFVYASSLAVPALLVFCCLDASTLILHGRQGIAGTEPRWLVPRDIERQTVPDTVASVLKKAACRRDGLASRFVTKPTGAQVCALSGCY